MPVPNKLHPTTCVKRGNLWLHDYAIFCEGCCWSIVVVFCFGFLYIYCATLGKRAAADAYLPCFDANLHFSILELGHGFPGHPEFVQTPESRQQHRSHFFGIPGRIQVFGFFSSVPVDHVLGFLRHICSFFSHVRDLLLRLSSSSSSSSSGLWLMCSLRTDSPSAGAPQRTSGACTFIQFCCRDDQNLEYFLIQLKETWVSLSGVFPHQEWL